MKIDIDSNTHYLRDFRISSAGHLPLGPGTRIEVLGMETTRPDLRTTLVSATVRLSAEVGICSAHCSICKTRAPEPNTYDPLWFILQNHDGNRLVFADAEGCKDERDRWPVMGWRNLYDGTPDSGLTCPSCVEDLAKAREEIRARKTATI